MFLAAMALCIARQHFSLPSEFLAHWTEMCTALGNDDTLNLCTAAHTYFYCPMLEVRLQVIIVIACFSLQVAVAGEGCSPVLNAQREYRNNTLMQSVYFIRGERISPSQGMNKCIVQGLVGIDVA